MEKKKTPAPKRAGTKAKKSKPRPFDVALAAVRKFDGDPEALRKFLLAVAFLLDRDPP